jgi:hypothetical protein
MQEAEMRQLQSFLNRRNLFASFAGAAATFVLGVRADRGREPLPPVPGMDKAEMEFEIVNGWVLRRQDIAART